MVLNKIFYLYHMIKSDWFAIKLPNYSLRLVGGVICAGLVWECSVFLLLKKG